MPAENQPFNLIESPTPHQVAARIFTLLGVQMLLVDLLVSQNAIHSARPELTRLIRGQPLLR